MLEILKVLGRIFLIGFGLLCVAAGGLCTLIGAGQGLDAAWMVGIGIVSVVAGGALVRYIFKSWKQQAGGEGDA
jgi:Na+-translocating ferredoxin:NAD+ oxidoreductase RnfA subunit